MKARKNNMVPSKIMTYKWMTRRFGEQINMIKHKMRGGYKKRGKK